VSELAGEGRTIGPRDVVVHVVKRQLTLLPLIGLMFFTVSGGAYGLEDVIGGSAPGMAILLIVLTPIIWSLPAALMVAELSTALPVEGGFYHWVKIGMGRFWGYQEGAWAWLTTWVDMALYPVLFADYLSQTYFPGAASGKNVFLDLGFVQFDLHWLLCLLVIWPFAYVNIRGAKGVGDSSILFMAFILLPFIVMIAIGIPKLFTDGINPLHPFLPHGVGVLSAAGAGMWVVMWSYLGWDGLSTIAGEIENPRRNYPLSLAISIPLITLCYLLPVLAGLAASTDWQAWTAGYFPTLAGNLGGEWLKVWLTIGGLVSAIGLFSALLLSVSRVPFVMATDGWMPKFLTKEHDRYGTPWVAIVVCAFIYSLFTLGPFASLVVVDVCLYSLGLLLEFAALIALRIRYPDLERPFRVPGGWTGIAIITVLPLLIVLFAIYKQVGDSGISSMYLSVGAAAIAPLSYLPMKWLVKRDQPDVAVGIAGIDLPVAQAAP
jgi:amino acid transporter